MDAAASCVPFFGSTSFNRGPYLAAGPTGDVAAMVGCYGQGASSTPVVVARVNGSGQGVSNSNFTSSSNHVYPAYVDIGPGNHLGVAWAAFPGIGDRGVTVTGNAYFSTYDTAIFSGEQVDALGNLYVLAQAQGSTPVTLDASITLPANASAAMPVTWLVREGPSGPKVYGGPPSTYLADGQAGVFYFSALSGTLNLGCGPMVPTSPSSSYLARLDPLGACLYADVLPMSPSILADGQGGVLLYVPNATAPLDLGCGTKSVVPGGSTVFARLDGAGACVFGGSFGATGLGFRFGPGGAVVVSGSVGATAVDLGTGPLAPIGSQDLVVASLDPLGNVLGARRFGAPGLSLGGSVTESAKGDVYIKTSYAGVVDFGGGPVTAASGDVVMASLSPSCGHRWSRALHLTGQYLADVDGCGGLVVVSADTAFNPGGGTFIPANASFNQYLGFARFQP